MATFETLTILFTDMVDSTATLARLAPDAADQLQRSHLSLLRGIIAAHDGQEVKNLGDGVMAVFTSPSAALAAAVAMQQEVERENSAGGEAIGLRVGLSAGEVSREGDDYFGAPVVEAARLCALCLSGQIQCSALVKAMAGRRASQTFSSLGELILKGLPDPVAVLEVHWEPLPPAVAGSRLVGETLPESLERSRELFRQKAWADAHALLEAADLESPLGPEDLERRATAAYLIGRDEDCDESWARAFNELVSRGDSNYAVRCAFWLGFCLSVRGEGAAANAWFARAERLVDPADEDCLERGYLLLPLAMSAMFEGDAEGGLPVARRAVEIGERFGDPNVTILGRLVEGTSLTMLGQTSAGLALHDEVMLAITSDEVSPILAGLAFCAVVQTCHNSFDMRRAQEWTAALSRWCSSQPDLVMYRGQCLVHRSEIMQLKGAWPDARAEAQRACERLGDPPSFALGAALYQRGELHRLSGENAEAEEAYGEASRFGHEPQPGLALLRLAQGRADAAAASLRRVLNETHEAPSRARLLPAYVEILLATGDVVAARTAADELKAIGAAIEAPILAALSHHATGSVLLAEGDPASALAELRRAGTGWRELDAPYEAARVRVLVADACRALGDEDAAALELDAARRIFEQLGAAPDLARLDR